MLKRPDRMLFWVAAVLIAGADQATKWLVYENLPGTRPVEIIPNFFNLHAAENTGVVWGFFDGWPGGVLLVSLAAASLIVAFFYIWSGRSRLEAFGYGMILGGAAGNLIDRVLFQHVRDFIDLVLWSWHWPTFNVADASIVVAVLLLALHYFVVAGGDDA